MLICNNRVNVSRSHMTSQNNMLIPLTPLVKGSQSLNLVLSPCAHCSTPEPHQKGPRACVGALRVQTDAPRTCARRRAPHGGVGPRTPRLSD